MQHLDDGFLHALADGEVPSDELGPVREHLDACDACRARLDEARMEAETARELIEVMEVPALESADRRFGGSADTTNRPTAQPSNRHGWMRPLAWAATLVLAAGIGYYGRGSAPFASQAQPVSVGRTDTVFLDVPPAVDQPRENALNRSAGLDRAARPEEPQAAPPEQPAAPARADARSELAGARRDADTAARRSLDSNLRLSEVVVTATTEGDRPKPVTTEKKEAESKLGQVTRQRAAAPPVALAEERMMAKSAADAALVVVTFPRAVELLGGRIKLIEGMVPARLEAVGRIVRVIYVVDEGDLVLAQISGADSLNWSLTGPIGVDSLARLRLQVR